MEAQFPSSFAGMIPSLGSSLFWESRIPIHGLHGAMEPDFLSCWLSSPFSFAGPFALEFPLSL
jgi:hypothetical protein